MTYKKSHTQPKIDARSSIISPATDPPSSPISPSSLTPTAANQLSPTTVDYGSLYEAMIENEKEEGDGDDDEDYNNQVPSSLGSMISSLDGDELAHKIDVIEQLENISFLRVIYLGVASLDEKRLFLKKLSDGLSETLFRQTPITSPPTHSPHPTSSSSLTTTHKYEFYEKKHHLFPLNIFKSEDVNVDYTDLLEDSGVVIVEADFTHDNSTPHVQPTYYDMDFILNYIYLQSISSHSPSILESILSPSTSHHHHSPLHHWQAQPFHGHLFSDKDTPMGIDLCVYFYHDAESPMEVTKNLEILWKIHALNIPILPILSMSNQKPCQQQNAETLNTSITSLPPSSPTRTIGMINSTTTTSTTDSYTNQRPIEIRRNDLATIFSKWKIKMMDISDLDIIDQPSFNQKGKAKKGINQDKILEKKLGSLWANASMLAPTPYHILTLFQFMVIDRWVVSKLLKTINDIAIDRRNGKYKEEKKNNENDNDNKNKEPSSSISVKVKNDINKKNNPDENNNDEDNNNNNDNSNSSNSHDTMINIGSSIKDQQSTTHSSLTNHSSSSSSSSLFTQNTLSIPSSENTYHEGKVKLVTSLSNYNHPSHQHQHHHQHRPHHHHSHHLLQDQHHRSTTFSFSKYYKSNRQIIQHFALPCLIVMMGILFYTTPHNYFHLTSPSSRWHASLVMISHQKGKAMNFMVNVYDANDQPSWAPELPLLSTNLPLMHSTSSHSTSKTTFSSSSSSPDISISTDIYPLPNNSDTTTRTMNGQYLYSISLPPCHLLDPHLPYVIQVKQIPNLFDKTNGIQGSPFYLSEKLICENDDDGMAKNKEDTSDTWLEQYIEMIQHFRQHTLMYITHSAKIFDASLDDSIIEDN